MYYKQREFYGKDLQLRLGVRMMSFRVEEILNAEFSRSFRGYNPDEVDEFLEEIANQMELLYKEQAKLQEENRELGRRLREKEKYLDQLESKMEEWQKQNEVERELAKREAQMVIQTAQLKAQKIIEEAEKEKLKIEQDYQQTMEKYQIFRMRFKSLLQTFIDSLDWKAEEPKFSSSTNREEEKPLASSQAEVARFSLKDLGKNSKF